jgi:hypothetical protein
MEQLIYISTSHTEPALNVVHDILAVSRRNNRADDLTGLLIVGGRRFLQVLEGPRTSLDATYRRIAADDRHFAMVKLSRKLITKRSFPDWEMGYHQGAGGGLVEIVERLSEPVDDPCLRAEIRGFAQLHSKAA